MALMLTQMTELEAVNAMLSVIGEQPVNTLEDSGVTEASLARTMLHNVSRDIQTVGLNCNSESNYRISPDSEGFIYVPSSCIQIDASDASLAIVKRGRKLYDKDSHTYVFEGVLEVDIVFFLSFDELPSAVTQYVYIRAARKFAASVLGSDTLDNLTADDEADAKKLMERLENRNRDLNVFDSYDTFKVINRRANPKFRG